MNDEGNHFRGESFGAPILYEISSQTYLQTLISHFKSCLLLEKSNKSPDDLMQHVKSIEREISLLDDWNTELEELLEMKDLEIDRLNEDIENLDYDLAEADKEINMFKKRAEEIKEAIELKEMICARIQARGEVKENRAVTPNVIDRKKIVKGFKCRCESPSLV